MTFRIPTRLRAAGWHLLFSAALAAAAALIVFWLWYPPPYASLAGGLGLFGLLLGVDLVMGPVLTAVVADPRKPKAELVRDVAVILSLQMAAFAYGLYSVAQARPVFLSFEIDRMRVVTAADVDDASLREAPAGIGGLSWTGPRVIAAPKPSDPTEQMRSIELGMAGFDLSMVPRYWRVYDDVQRAAAWQAARPVAALMQRYPERAGEIERVARQLNQPVESLRFLPLVSRRASWVAIMAAPEGNMQAYLPLDGFF